MIGKKNVNDFIFYKTRPILNAFGIGQQTFSQMGEDIIISNMFKFLGIDKPSYIDIGAHDPFTISNTALLYRNGSTGVNVEPDPTLIDKFKTCRKRDVNLNIGITETDGEMDFYVMSSKPFNTFSREEAYRLRDEGFATIEKVIKVKTRNINSVITEYCEGVFPDFMSLDTEGYELPILETIDWANNYPKAICCETAIYGSWKKNFELINWIVGKGYNVFADTSTNTIFLHKTLDLGAKE